MNEDPFTLQGTQRTYSGGGRPDGETYTSKEFELKSGLVIAEIEHHGRGEFQLRFVPTEGLSEGKAIGGGMAAGAATGAVIGSVLPVAGTVLGGVIGGAAGLLAGGAFGPRIWTPVDEEGELQTWAIMRVSGTENDDDSLPPGKYHIEVESEAKWRCQFVQPALAQGTGSLLGDWDDLDNEGLFEPTLSITGPFKPVRRPLLVCIEHLGGGLFDAEAFSVDGTHYCALYQQEGQFYIEDHETNIIPGKEYVFYIYADGQWRMSFKEGY